MVDGRHLKIAHAGWFAVAAAALLLQGCAQTAPSGPSVRMFAADLAGAAKSCAVPSVTAAAGQTADAAMKVSNDGGWCAISVNNGGRPYDAGLLTTKPGHGKVLIHSVGSATRIDYTPEPRFAGSDSFMVRLIPGDATIRVSVTVGP